MDLSCLKSLTRRPIFNQNNEQHQSQQPQLQRRLNCWDLIFYGVGCSVGAGLYSLVGVGAHTAGPSISLSFGVAGIACCFTSLSYAEFASLLQKAGSAYTYAYVAFGELTGWLVGWNLTLGYAVSAAVVARSWAEYLVGLFDKKQEWQWMTKFPLSVPTSNEDPLTCCPLSIVIIALSTCVLVAGVKESTRFNTIMTVLNLTVLSFIVLAGATVVDPENWQPFFPHGFSGMSAGAGLVFFSYLGFDMVSCLAEEVENPAIKMPIGIIGSLLLSMTIYVAVASVVVGMAPVELLGDDTPIVHALLANACCSHTEQIASVNGGDIMSCLATTCEAGGNRLLLLVGSRLVAIGAVLGLTTATFACLMGQPRIFYSIARDGLFFQIYAKVNPKTGIPTLGTIITGAFTSIIACFFDLESLANVISLGTLQVFTLVNAAVILLRLRPSLILGDKDVDEIPQHLQETAEKHTSVARSLGLIDQTSRDVLKSLRNSTRGNENARESDPTKPILLLAGFTASSLILSVVLSKGSYWAGFPAIVILTVCAVILHLSVPQESDLILPTCFRCPFVPLVPLCGIFCNCYMMGSMEAKSWIMISVWLLIGLMFYFCYGIHHSILNESKNTLRRSIQSGEKRPLLLSEDDANAL